MTVLILDGMTSNLIRRWSWIWGSCEFTIRRCFFYQKEKNVWKPQVNIK